MAENKNSNEANVNIFERLSFIQGSLAVGKNNVNEYAHYSYRTVEDIIDAVKPLLRKTKTVLLFHEDIFEVAGRIMMKETVTLKANDGDEISTSTVVQVGAHKGMCAEQCFGSAAIYARRYAASALLLVAGEPDPDVVASHGGNNSVRNINGNVAGNNNYNYNNHR